jgi:hypothetical protein
MIYGNPQYRIDDDTTDRIGIRTLVMSKLWQPSRWPLTIAELDAEKPEIPGVDGGVVFIGEQTRPLRGALRTFWTFEGVNGDGKSVTFKGRTNSPDYSFDPGFSQVSIVKHPNWKELKAAWGGQVLDGQVTFPEVVPKGGGGSSGAVKSKSEGQTNPMFGHEDFFRMEGTYSFRYAAFDPTAANVGVGRIATTLPGRAPTFADRNWLKAPATWQRRGPVFDITEVYWLSGAGGWPKQIYTDNPTAEPSNSTPTNALT